MDPIRPREEKLIALLAQGNITVSEACRQCGFHPESKTIREALKPGGRLNGHLRAKMNELGLTVEVALIRLREAYDRKRTETIKRPGYDGSLKVSQVKETADPKDEQWAIEQTLKLHDAYPRVKDEHVAAGPLRVAITEDTVSTPDGRTGRRMVVEIGEVGQ